MSSASPPGGGPQPPGPSRLLGRIFGGRGVQPGADAEDAVPVPKPAGSRTLPVLAKPAAMHVERRVQAESDEVQEIIPNLAQKVKQLEELLDKKEK